MNNNELTTTVVPGGPLGVALEDIKRPPRPAELLNKTTKGSEETLDNAGTDGNTMASNPGVVSV